MYFLILVPLLGMCAYASFSPAGQRVFTFVVWATATALYACLFWVWWVLLDGFSWLQWFFGFAIFSSMLPALAIFALGSAINKAGKQ